MNTLAVFGSHSTLFISLESSRLKKSSLNTHRVDLDATQVLIRRLIGVRILFVFDILSGKVSSPPLLAELGLCVSSYPTRRREFFQIDYHRTNYGTFEPINAALHSFNEMALWLN
jgi:hypothetical protein